MTPGEFYTTQFYSWECRGRGWFVSDHPVQLEPPFIPYIRKGYPQEQIDDGKRHTWLSKFVEAWGGKKKPIMVEQDVLDYETIEPFPCVPDRDLCAVQVKFPHDRKVPIEKMKALLVMFSYIESTLSFEIIGTASEITLQFVCDRFSYDGVESYLTAYFPHCSLIQTNIYVDDILRDDLATAVVDFGLQHEFIRPIATHKSFSLDPLITFFGTLDTLGTDEQAGMQILFQSAMNKWSESIMRSVTMYDGTSFFTDAPEFPELAKEKAQGALFGVAIRSFAQAKELDKAFQLLERISIAIMQASKGNSNQLIPLATKTYEFETRVDDMFLRESHRLGMLLNINELLTLLHFPNESITSKKLYTATRKTVETPTIALGKPCILGDNSHNGMSTAVSFGIDERMKHTHVIGATGTGKSTLLINLVIQDIEQGHGVVVFDPHGDLTGDIMASIPDDRLHDVVLVDPADDEFPIGLNILQAKNDIEKEVLSSDLVASFKRLSTSWGDQMTAVLANAILAILESPSGGTLHDLRRFLVEKEFRSAFLKKVSDPVVLYYWHKEFPLLKTNSIGPILTRLDTFLRPKSIRNMLVQKEGLDFEALLNGNKIILLRLSQGLIGIENSYLLGSLVFSKLHQVILRRQQNADRNPVFVYVDEFQHFITPSIKDMIAGIRKYNVGLTLSHQDLRQLQRDDSELLHSVLNNVSNRIVFRVGEPDAKKLQEGFADFDSTDLQNLGKGEAVVRIEQPKFDCSLTTRMPPERVNGVWQKKLQVIIDHSREQYATPKEDVEKILFMSLNGDRRAKEDTQKPVQETEHGVKEPYRPPEPGSLYEEDIAHEVPQPLAQTSITAHRYLQNLVKKMAEAKGYTAVLEKQVPNGDGQVDVLLTKNNKTIAVEICVTTDAEWEVHNIEKCIEAGYDMIVSMSGDAKQLDKIQKACNTAISRFSEKHIYFYTPDVFFEFLDAQQNPPAKAEEQTIKGYRVNVTYDDVSREDMDRKRASVAKVVMDSLRKNKKK